MTDGSSKLPLTSAHIALAWIVFDTGAVLLLVALPAIGASVGLALERLERLVTSLERFSRD